MSDSQAKLLRQGYTFSPQHSATRRGFRFRETHKVHQITCEDWNVPCLPLRCQCLPGLAAYHFERIDNADVGMEHASLHKSFGELFVLF